MDILDSNFKLHFKIDTVIPCLLFQKETAIIAFGGYLKPEHNIKCIVNLNVEVDELKKVITTELQHKGKSMVKNWNIYGVIEYQ